MKRTYAIIGFTIGVAVTAAAMMLLQRARDARREIQLFSDVYCPVQQSIDDIAKTYDRGDTELAQRKTRLLQERWKEFMRDGPSPEQFSNEIMQLGTAATRPAN